ncbi:Rdx family-domain-containing protein [Daldinia bambusicola]|nr:Rdx family-domain-containing protein [Daldinia bambusicola]
MAETKTSPSSSNSNSNSASAPASSLQSPFPLPRITIRFCTQCKWMLRAAYFAQELLSTFSTSLGEVALQPSTGGTFVVEIFFQSPSTTTTSSSSSSSSSSPSILNRVLWDRKTDGGFPETKELKRRVRDVIEPGRDLGHVDKDHAGSKAKEEGGNSTTTTAAAAVTSDSSGSSGAGAGATGGAGNPRSIAEDENTLGLNTHPGETIGGPAAAACSKPGIESARTNAATQRENGEGGCEDCK